MFRLVKTNLVSLVSRHIINYGTPANIKYFWSFGSLAGLMLVIQLVTGIILAMHYTPHISEAFDSVEHIMRNVNYGWLLRYLHANGASMFFLVIYIHIARGLFYKSYNWNIGVWYTGIIIFLLMMGTAFIGYVLPWGQMSFWGATVITNLVTAVPYLGKHIAFWLWGGFSVDNATLKRFFSLHYILPIILTAVVVVHLYFLHEKGSTNPISQESFDKCNFHPYFTYKDTLSLFLLFIIYGFFVFFEPNALGHSDNYIEANSLVTPLHIVPEWYFLPFYAILRACPSKIGGVISMLLAILFLFALPLLEIDSYKITSINFNLIDTFIINIFFGNFLLLMWLGSQVAEQPFIFIAKISSLIYFLSLFFYSIRSYFVK